MSNHLALWLGGTPPHPVADAPSMDCIIRWNLNGRWSPEVGGVPVVPVCEICDAALKDEAYFAAIEWHERASKVVGAGGASLRETPWHDDWRLWWTLDLLVHDTIWLWIRAIESVRVLLERYRPQVVSVWGSDESFGWMRATVLEALGRFAPPDTRVLSASTAGSSTVRQPTRKVGFEVVEWWEPAVPIDDLFRLEGEGQLDQSVERLRLVSLSRRAVLRRPLDVRVDVLNFEVACLSGTAGFGLDTGMFNARVYLWPAQLRLGSRPPLPIDVRSGLRCTLEIGVDGQARLSIDGQVVDEEKAGPGRSPAIELGHYDLDGDSETEWRFAAWGARPAVPPAVRRPPLYRRILRRLFRRRGAPQSAASNPPAASPDLRFLSVKAASPDPLPPPSSQERDDLRVLVLSFGDELRWYFENEVAVPYDQFSDGIREAIAATGTAVATGLLIPAGSKIPRSLADSPAFIDLKALQPKLVLLDRVAADILDAWRSWRGRSGAGGRFPDYEGVSIDAWIAAQVEEALPYQAPKVLQAAALEALCRKKRPDAVVFTHFATSQRHLIGVVRGCGARLIAPVIGCDSQEHLLYGLRDPESGCPLADVYTVWGEAQKEALEARGPLPRPLFATGRTRQDAFARRAIRPSSPGWLQQIGLPPHVHWAITFGDVLRSTNKASILTYGNALEIFAAMLRGLDKRQDVCIIYKPWRGDDLKLVRTLVEEVDDPRVFVLDPDCVPFHNVDLLAHSIAVVSSPTSMLAEYAAMGGRPILLALPDTRYYHGEIIERLFTPYSRAVRSVDDMEAAIREALQHPRFVLEAAERSALSRAFGEPDGKSAERLADRVLEGVEKQRREAISPPG